MTWRATFAVFHTYSMDAVHMCDDQRVDFRGARRDLLASTPFMAQVVYQSEFREVSLLKTPSRIVEMGLNPLLHPVIRGVAMSLANACRTQRGRFGTVSASIESGAVAAELARSGDGGVSLSL